MDKLPDLDPLIHAKVRLAVVSLLSGVKEADFSYLRDQLDLTDGNLSVHLRKLEDAGYISVKKAFIGKKPRTTHRITKAGRKAFETYRRNLEVLLRLSLESERTEPGGDG